MMSAPWNVLFVMLMGLRHITMVQAAFGVPIEPSRLVQRLALQYRRGNEDDSQWYSPPPPPASIAEPTSTATPYTSLARPPMGQRAFQTDVTTMSELDAILRDETDDRLVVVKFYASWCRTCAMLGLKMEKLASEHADWTSTDGTMPLTIEPLRRGNVRFVNVEYGAARELCRELQIAKLPTIHMYMPISGHRTLNKVQDFSCSLKEFYRIQDLTVGYVEQQQHQRVLAAAATRDVVASTEMDALEKTLDAGRELIRAQLERTDAANREVVPAAARDKTKTGFWRRLRNRSPSSDAP